MSVGAWASHHGALAVFLGASAVYSVLAVRPVANLPLGGDEPHYLMICHSMCVDGDVNLANNWSEDHYLQFFPFKGLKPHAFPYVPNGPLISIHGVGLPLLLLPPYCLLRSVTSARLVLALLSALTVSQAFLLVRAATSDGTVATTATAAVALTVPMIVHSTQLYPELPAALCLVLAARALTAKCRPLKWLVTLTVAVAFLPWLHIKYGLLSLALLLCGLRCIRKDPAWLPILLGVPAISGLIYLFLSQSWYGSLSPIYRYSVGQGWWSFSPPDLVKGLAATLFDREYGLVVYSPFFMAAFAGFGVMLRRSPAYAHVALLVGVHLLAVSPFGCQIGRSFPGRYVVPVVPLLALPLAFLLKWVREARWPAMLLVHASLAIAAAVLIALPEAYMDYDGMVNVPIVRHIQYAFPTIVSWNSWSALPWLAVAATAVIGGALEPREHYAPRH